MNINSLKSITAMKYSGQLGKAQRELLDFISKAKSVTAYDVVKALGETHRKRIKELCDKGIIHRFGTVFCHQTNRQVSLYEVKDGQWVFPNPPRRKPTRGQLEAQIRALKAQMAEMMSEAYDKGFIIGMNLSKSMKYLGMGG